MSLFRRDIENDHRLHMKGKSGGGGGGGTQVQKTVPWDGQQPYLKDVFGQAQNNYRSGGPEYFGGQTYADLSGQTNNALGMMENRAMSGSPLNDGAKDLVQSTMNGDYLNSNPYLDQMFQQGADKIKGNVNAQFSSAGRTGSGAHAGRMYEEQGDLYNNMYGGQYQQERKNQLAAATLAPGLAQNDYADMDRLAKVGSVYEGQNQKGINEDMARFNHYENLADENLAKYVAAIQGNYGGTSTTTSKDSGGGKDWLAGAAGGAMTGLGLGEGMGLTGMAALGPWAAGGALLGAVL
jgi:hypothetical protein